MNYYSVKDLSETLRRVRIKRDEVKKVLFAWGDTWIPESGINGDTYDQIKGENHWEGGFILELNNGEVICISGYNDFTGWGCMDYVMLQKYNNTKTDNTWNVYKKMFQIEWKEYKDANKNKKIEADKDPVDLNRWINKEIELDKE